MLKNFIKTIKGRRKNAPDGLAAVNAMLIELHNAGQTVDPSRLSKLLAIAHIWSIKLLDRPLHNAHYSNVGGIPVSLNIHSALRSYGTQEVTDLIPLSDFDLPYPALKDEDDLRIIREVIKAYEFISTYALRKILERDLPKHENFARISNATLAKMFKHPAAA